MPVPTDGDVAVVRPYYLIEEAYTKGHSRFQETAQEAPDDPDEATEAASLALEGFKQYAKWSDTVAPRLRAMAGYADNGHGTFTDNRKVAAIHPGCEEDEPAEADLVDAHRVYQTLVEAFDAGAVDAASGREKDLDRAPEW